VQAGRAAAGGPARHLGIVSANLFFQAGLVGHAAN